MRRVVKPFTVEIRNRSRKAAVPKWSDLGDGSEVVSETASVPAVDTLPNKPAGLVLPATDQPAMYTPPEPYLDPRRPAPAPRMQAAPVSSSEAPSSTRSGRILPRIDVPSEADREPQAEAAGEDLGITVEPKAEMRREPAESIAAPRPVDEPSVRTEPLASEADGEAATLVLRPGRKRLTRDDFCRGERWKARLPVAVHRGVRGRER